MTSPNRITKDPTSGQWTANLNHDVSIKQTEIRKALEGFGELTREHYDTLIDALNGGVDFSMKSEKPLSPIFLEALENVNNTVFVFDAAIKGMNKYQFLSMFQETYKRRDNINSQINELNIKEDLSTGGILSGKKMSLDDLYLSIEKTFIDLNKKVSETPEDKLVSNKPKPETRKPKPETLKPFKMNGGGWPISSLFSRQTDTEENVAWWSNFAGIGGVTLGTGVNVGIPIASGLGLNSGYVVGVIAGTIGIGIGLGVLLSIKLSCAIADRILTDNAEDNYRIHSSEYVNGPLSIINVWYGHFVRVWERMGINSLKIKGYDTGISLSRIGFVLSGGICTVGDIVNNLISAPFVGFSYLAKKMFSRNNAAIVPMNGEPNPAIVPMNGEPNPAIVLMYNDPNPLAPIDLRQIDMTPIDRYTKNINIYENNLLLLEGKDADTYEALQKKLNNIYKICPSCFKHTCNNGRYITCRQCNGACHYDNIIGACLFAYETCNRKDDAKNRCPLCRNHWKLCTGKQLSLLPETDADKGFSVVDGPCLQSDNVALTDDEIIADNKILIGILDRNLTEEHKAEIAREPENELDGDVLYKTRTKTSTGNSSKVVPINDNILGGSKKRNKKSKHHRNKKTRRRQTRR